MRRASLVFALALTAACAARAPATAPVGSSGPRVVSSNIVRQDYAGSEACRACHADLFAKWDASPMRRMTRHAGIDAISAPFDDTQFKFMDDSATMFERGSPPNSARYMQIHSHDQGDALFRITKVIGGRTREDFVGVEVRDPTEPTPPNAVEFVLPVSYLRFDQRWRYKGYSVMSPERPGLRRGAVWSQTCIFCHNTPPAFATLYDDIGSISRPTYQGSVSVELPAARALHYEVTSPSGLTHALSGELAALGVDPLTRAGLDPSDLQKSLKLAIEQTGELFAQRQLVELGIGCEACHGGARAHANDPSILPSFVPRSDFLRVTNASGAEPGHAEAVNRTCAKCHTVLFSRYEYTWEGGQRRHAPGGSNINSGEARDFLLGHCSNQMTCTSCHDPHTEDSRADLDALAGPRGNALCTKCHTAFDSDAKVSAHSHHSPGSAGSYCINCHMPKKNMGLTYSLTRYHRIGSPTDVERVERDRPLECALCHGDKSVDEMVKTMEKLWHVRYDRAALHRLYGEDLTVNVLKATLLWGKPHEQAVAAAIAGDDRRRDLVDLVIAQLDDRYPLVRFFAARSLEKITGAPLDLDLHAPGIELETAARRALAMGHAP